MKHPDEFKIWHDYMNRLQTVGEGLDREQIYEGLRERTPYIARRNATQRVFEESGINLLLDQLIVIQTEEDLTNILGEQDASTDIPQTTE